MPTESTIAKPPEQPSPRYIKAPEPKPVEIKKPSTVSHLHFALEKFGEMAQNTLEKRAAIANNLRTAIQNKELKTTLSILTDIAAEIQKDHGLSDEDTVNFGYEVFLVAFDPIDFPADLKEKMALGIRNKLREEIIQPNAPASQPMPRAQPEKAIPAPAPPPKKAETPKFGRAPPPAKEKKKDDEDEDDKKSELMRQIEAKQAAKKLEQEKKKEAERQKKLAKEQERQAMAKGFEGTELSKVSSRLSPTTLALLKKMKDKEK
jgi:hypothetical protein